MTRSSPRSKRRTRLMGSGTWLTIYNSRPALRRRDVWNAGRPQGRQKTMAKQERGLGRTVNPDRLYEPETSGSTRPWKRHFRRATHWRIRWSPAFAQPLHRTTDSKLRDTSDLKASRSLTRVLEAGARRPDALRARRAGYREARRAEVQQGRIRSRSDLLERYARIRKTNSGSTN